MSRSRNLHRYQTRLGACKSTTGQQAYRGQSFDQAARRPFFTFRFFGRTLAVMNEYVRTHPEFSLCGLNCSLCPRHATEGSSRCPGCGATDFADTHPTCALITCAKKHGSPEFCFACAEYPCERYRTIGGTDSFISYRRVRENLEKARGDIHAYLAELAEREAFLGRLLDRWNDGRRKGFYCLAANDLPIASVREVRASLEKIEAQGEEAGTGALPPGSKERALAAVRLIAEEAEKAGFELALRK